MNYNYLEKPLRDAKNYSLDLSQLNPIKFTIKSKLFMIDENYIDNNTERLRILNNYNRIR